MVVAHHHQDWASVLLGKTSLGEPFSVPDVLSQFNRVPLFNIALPLLTIAHACTVYINLHRDERLGRRAEIGKWQSFFCFMIGGAGGSVITALLLSNPVPVFNMSFFPIMVAGWLALTFVPGVYHLLAEVPFINAQISMLAAVNRTLCVCQGVEMALRAAPGEYILAVVCGIALSSAGGILVELFQLNHFMAGFKPVSFQDLLRRLALIIVCSLSYTASMTKMVKDQGPWDELIMMSIALVLSGNGLWNSFISTKPVFVPPSKSTLHPKKKS